MGMLTPTSVIRPMVNAAYRGYIPFMWKQKSMIPKTILHDVIEERQLRYLRQLRPDGPGRRPVQHYVYPLPGKPEIHMLWTDTPCFTTCWNDGNAFHRAIRTPKIEFILVQHPWLENDCHFRRYHPALQYQIRGK